MAVPVVGSLLANVAVATVGAGFQPRRPRENRLLQSAQRVLMESRRLSHMPVCTRFFVRSPSEVSARGEAPIPAFPPFPPPIFSVPATADTVNLMRAS